MIHRIQTETVPDLWALVYPHAKASMRWHPFMDDEDLFNQILSGHAQLFMATRAEGGGFLGFAACEMLQYPKCRVANVLAAGGEHGFLGVLVGELFPEMETWAKEHNADTFACHGRPGWSRVAKRIKGSRTLALAAAWRPIGYERRRCTGSDNPGH